MILEDVLGLSKLYAARYSLYFVALFRNSALERFEEEKGDVTVASIIYLIVGVTLQDKFISGLDIKNISWWDRAVLELVFWVSLGLVAMLTGRIFRSFSDTAEFISVFRVVPVAFVCGAYAASLAKGIVYLLSILLFEFPALPHLLDMFASSVIVLRYLPSELRTRAQCKIGQSRTIAGVIFIVVLATDLTFVYSTAFLKR